MPSTTYTKSIDDLWAEVRATLNDTQAPYRYTDALLMQYYNTALREVFRYRPDAYIGNFTSGVLTGAVITSYYTTDLGQTPATPFPLDDKLFYSPVVFYVTGRADLTDDEFADNNRAMTLLAAFRSMLIGPGG